jgi:hypothetical protein
MGFVRGRPQAAWAAIGLALAAPAFAHAQDAAPQTPPPPAQAAPAPDKSGFTLFDPTPDADLRSFCTDRPTKSTLACTVDAGHFQIESDIFNATFQHLGGVTTDTYLFTNPTLKLGLTNTTDAELTIAPIETVVTHDHVTGSDSTLTGVGDLFAKLKWNLIGDDGGDVAVTLAPYVKAPTARHGIGNGAVEEGVLLPITLTLPAGWALTIDPEADALKNANDNGRHLNYSGLLNFSHAITKTISGAVEIWGDVNDDPAGTVRQRSLDFALTWIPAKTPNLQFDVGTNFGLNSATPGAQAYFGVSRRF